MCRIDIEAGMHTLRPFWVPMATVFILYFFVWGQTWDKKIPFASWIVVLPPFTPLVFGCSQFPCFPHFLPHLDFPMPCCGLTVGLVLLNPGLGLRFSLSFPWLLRGPDIMAPCGVIHGEWVHGQWVPTELKKKKKDNMSPSTEKSTISTGLEKSKCKSI